MRPRSPSRWRHRLSTPTDRAGTFRPRAGKLVTFEIITTIDLERDSPAYTKLVAALSNTSTPCELRATLTAERLPLTDATGMAKPLGTDARFTIGEVRINLHLLLSTGKDLLEQPLAVRSKAKQGAMGQVSSSPLLVVTVEGVDALDYIARALRPSTKEAARSGPGAALGRPALQTAHDLRCSDGSW